MWVLTRALPTGKGTRGLPGNTIYSATQFGPGGVGQVDPMFRPDKAAVYDRAKLTKVSRQQQAACCMPCAVHTLCAACCTACAACGCAAGCRGAAPAARAVQRSHGQRIAGRVGVTIIGCFGDAGYNQRRLSQDDDDDDVDLGEDMGMSEQRMTSSYRAITSSNIEQYGLLLPPRGL